jgi:molybdopterin adenylyltransferase
VDLIICCGGTGLGPRDRTPEAVRSLTPFQPCPGLVVAMVTASLQITPHAMLGRPEAGVCNGRLVLAVPGSRAAAVENVTAVLPALPHALQLLSLHPRSHSSSDSHAAPNPSH